jgi:hypothetical protein
LRKDAGAEDDQKVFGLEVHTVHNVLYIHSPHGGPAEKR